MKRDAAVDNKDRGRKCEVRLASLAPENAVPAFCTITSGDGIY